MQKTLIESPIGQQFLAASHFVDSQIEVLTFLQHRQPGQIVALLDLGQPRTEFGRDRPVRLKLGDQQADLLDNPLDGRHVALGGEFHLLGKGLLQGVKYF